MTNERIPENVATALKILSTFVDELPQNVEYLPLICSAIVELTHVAKP